MRTFVISLGDREEQNDRNINVINAHALAWKGGCQVENEGQGSIHKLIV